MYIFIGGALLFLVWEVGSSLRDIKQVLWDIRREIERQGGK